MSRCLTTCPHEAIPPNWCMNAAYRSPTRMPAADIHNQCVVRKAEYMKRATKTKRFSQIKLCPDAMSRWFRHNDWYFNNQRAVNSSTRKLTKVAQTLACKHKHTSINNWTTMTCRGTVQKRKFLTRTSQRYYQRERCMLKRKFPTTPSFHCFQELCANLTK